MKYQIGDKVKIKTWEQLSQENEVDGIGHIQRPPVFISEMKELCGKIVTIREAFNNYYHLVEDNFSLVWADWMFEETISQNGEKEDIMQYNIGDEVTVIDRIYGHLFDIGETLKVVEYDEEVGKDYLCTNGTDKWWLKKDELRNDKHKSWESSPSKETMYQVGDVVLIKSLEQIERDLIIHGSGYLVDRNGIIFNSDMRRYCSRFLRIERLVYDPAYGGDCGYKVQENSWTFTNDMIVGKV